LVVDNEQLIADTLVRVLNLFGYTAKAAYGAEQALEMISGQPYDFLVTDVVMGDHMSGIDLVINVNALVPDCKTVLMSGHARTADLLRAAEEKGYHFSVLAKPVHPNEILERLQAVT